ncbi:probable E3 ubiquitin-protein ligase ZFP1 [Rosa rugosa]|uniref:probable E3 ubiquitin-protein ligase ZFP1 n=1 Tax=Rosa rugosa TaxID=74645 RepID=UPI002B40A059|nr:probable E3 ubiquitin-protein ligase ZFP1 [Rosa rugosa]
MADPNKSHVVPSVFIDHDENGHGGNGNFMDEVDGSRNIDNYECSAQDYGYTTGGQINTQITTSKFRAADISIGSSSGKVDSEDELTESSNNDGVLENCLASYVQAIFAQHRAIFDYSEWLRSHMASSTELLFGRNQWQINLTDLFPPHHYNSVVYWRTKVAEASKIQRPMWTVSHMMTLSPMEKVISYYRASKVADNLNDEDLRCFLEEQLCKEKAGLSEKTIAMRLKTKVYVASKVEENPDACSICMAGYKDRDKVASLYYCCHEYHEECIKEWLLKSNLCPMCRALAIIPEDYPCWDADVQLHQAFFLHLQYAI